MNRRFLTAVFIAVCCFLFVGESDACDLPPIAKISNPYTQTVCVGCPAEFDGSTSYDQDEEGNSIDVYYWNYSEDSNWHEDGKEPNHTFDTAGLYWVYLYVKDDEGVMSENYDYCQVYVIGVDKVVKSGTTDEGPLYVCPGDTVSLEAKPAPADASFPSGEPHWTIESEPNGANASLNPSSGSSTTTLSGITKQGDYVIKAQCGDSDTGDTIIVRLPIGVCWTNIVPGFSCPPWPWQGDEKEWSDDCQNKVIIRCETYSCGGISGDAFVYSYKPDGGSETAVGVCVWTGGINTYMYGMDINSKYFVKIEHASCNDQKGIDSHGEGCEDYWCYRYATYDCLNEDLSILWRRTTVGSKCPCDGGPTGGGVMPDPYGPSTEACPGPGAPGPEDGQGKHWCWPN